MERRHFLTTGSLALVGAIAGSSLIARADNLEPEEKANSTVGVTIDRNHGHTLTLDLVGVITALQSANRTGKVSFDIQGDSGHPHAVELTFLDIMRLLTEGSISVITTEVAGHTHPVTIRLTL